MDKEKGIERMVRSKIKTAPMLVPKVILISPPIKRATKKPTIITMHKPKN
jgi:hypothetical protein